MTTRQMYNVVLTNENKGQTSTQLRVNTTKEKKNEKDIQDIPVKINIKRHRCRRGSQSYLIIHQLSVVKETKVVRYMYKVSQNLSTRDSKTNIFIYNKKKA